MTAVVDVSQVEQDLAASRPDQSAALSLPPSLGWSCDLGSHENRPDRGAGVRSAERGGEDLAGFIAHGDLVDQRQGPVAHLGGGLLDDRDEVVAVELLGHIG